MKKNHYLIQTAMVLIVLSSQLLFAQGIKQELLNHSTFKITEQSKDNSYGFTEKNPIKVGGIKSKEGSMKERRFQNALTVPNGEEIEYVHLGSYCMFDTPNSPIEGKEHLLDRFGIYLHRIHHLTLNEPQNERNRVNHEV